MTNNYILYTSLVACTTEHATRLVSTDLRNHELGANDSHEQFFNKLADSQNRVNSSLTEPQFISFHFKMRQVFLCYAYSRFINSQITEKRDSCTFTTWLK